MPFLAALIPAVIGGAAAIGASAIGASAANKAGKLQDETNRRVEGYSAPYREAGTNALASLEAAYGLGDAGTLDQRRNMLTQGFESSPLYQYTYQPAVDEATKAAERSGSAGGFLDSGRTIKAIQDRAARIGGQTFGNYLGGLDTLANRGQAAASGQASAAQAGTNASNAATVGGANALISGIGGVNNAVQSGFNNYNYLKGQSAYGPSAGVNAFNSGNPIY